MRKFIRPFDEISHDDVGLVGGKNASLGELYTHLRTAGVRVPPGFAITADAYDAVIDSARLRLPMQRFLDGVDAQDVCRLATAGATVRALIEHAPWPHELEEEVAAAYLALGGVGAAPAAAAVRSSATAEDLPEASFAGQQETYLNICGVPAVLAACRRCFASLFTDRAIAYRIDHGFDHMAVRLSIGVQRMVRADLGSAGIMFTLDPESGSPSVVVINASYGLGDLVVAGGVDPDEIWLFKPTLDRGAHAIIRRAVGRKDAKLVLDDAGRPHRVDVAAEEREMLSLTDADAVELARAAIAIEAHYSALRGTPSPMDIEWAKDGADHRLYVLQARPETVHRGRAVERVEVFELHPPAHAIPVVSGRAVGQKIGVGPARCIRTAAELPTFQAGEVLVSEQTDPHWEPVMKRAAAIVTERGGRTCHAAIVSRELGVPCVVGTETATRVIGDGEPITVSCAEGETGYVYRGAVPFERKAVDLGRLPSTATAVMVDIANPDEAFRVATLPARGVGLARVELIIANSVRVHPLALLHPDRVRDADARAQIASLTSGYEQPAEYFVERLAEGVALIAAAFHPRPVLVRLSDFKSNEYAGLLGGRDFEPAEENPMLGFRGAYRYAHPRYREAFALECRAMRRVRADMGFENVKLMIPFCRTPDEGRRVLQVMAAHGLRRGEAGLSVYVMCELPSNVVLAREFAEIFDGFAIGSSGLTQLVLGIDRDSELVAPALDERDPAVLRMIADVIAAARAAERPIGICGQAPGDHPELTRFLVERGITSISLTADAFVRGVEAVAAAERDSASLRRPPSR